MFKRNSFSYSSNICYHSGVFQAIDVAKAVVNLSLWIYSALLLLTTPLLLLYLLWRSRKDPAYRQRLAERFALTLPFAAASRGIVLHTVSVGEFNAAKPLIKQLLQQYPTAPLTITCTTPTASSAIIALCQRYALQGTKVYHCYLPFDYPVLMRRWLKFMQPQLLLILETELWPNLLANCKVLAVPTLVINARLSKRSAKGYRRFYWFSQPMLQRVSMILTQDKNSARRFKVLGANNVEVAGNLKYELDVPGHSIELAQSLKPLLQGRQVWVAGSTHAGEDEILLQAYKQLKLTLPQLLLIIVPRHPERFDNVADLLDGQQLQFARRSQNQLPDAATDVWLADSMGELLSWYQLADLVFIGGSLIARGGHNPLEAMAFGKVVLSGPYVFNFQLVFQLLKQQHAYIQISDVSSIVSSVRQLIEQPALTAQIAARGLALYQQQQGAVGRVLLHVKQLAPWLNIDAMYSGRDVAWFDRQFFPKFELAYFAASFWQQRGAVTGQSKGRNTVWFIQQNSRHAVLRHYYRGGLIGKFNKDRFWPEPVSQSRAMAEFSLLWQMRQWGLPVPRPCAALFHAHAIGYSADIIIERIDTAIDLAHLLQKRQLNDDEWQQLGAMIARFHQHGVYHSDLNCHNILLDAEGKFWLIDFDKCAIRTPASWQQANLARLQRSFEKERSLHDGFNWSTEHWPLLLQGYNQQFN